MKKNLRIIVEGPDNVGKSTTIQNILSHFTGPNEKVFNITYHTGVKIDPEYRYSYMVNTYKQMWKNLSNIDNSILDRSHISESVFAKIYRDQDTQVLFDLEEPNKDLYLIMLTDNVQNLLDREDGLSLAKDKVSKMNELMFYNDGFDRSRINKLKIDVSHNNEAQVLEKILQFIGE